MDICCSVPDGKTIYFWKPTEIKRVYVVFFFVSNFPVYFFFFHHRVQHITKSCTAIYTHTKQIFELSNRNRRAFVERLLHKHRELVMKTLERQALHSVIQLQPIVPQNNAFSCVYIQAQLKLPRTPRKQNHPLPSLYKRRTLQFPKKSSRMQSQLEKLSLVSLQLCAIHITMHYASCAAAVSSFSIIYPFRCCATRPASSLFLRWYLLRFHLKRYLGCRGKKGFLWGLWKTLNSSLNLRVWWGRT